MPAEPSRGPVTRASWPAGPRPRARGGGRPPPERAAAMAAAARLAGEFLPVEELAERVVETIMELFTLAGPASDVSIRTGGWWRWRGPGGRAPGLPARARPAARDGHRGAGGRARPRRVVAGRAGRSDIVLSPDLRRLAEATKHPAVLAVRSRSGAGPSEPSSSPTRSGAPCGRQVRWPRPSRTRSRRRSSTPSVEDDGGSWPSCPRCTSSPASCGPAGHDAARRGGGPRGGAGAGRAEPGHLLLRSGRREPEIALREWDGTATSIGAAARPRYRAATPL